jgi:phosphoribosylformylglycinamidine synthase
VNGEVHVQDDVSLLRDVWEETSFNLEKFQTNSDCVKQERKWLLERTEPKYHMTFQPEKSKYLDLLTGVHAPDWKSK